MSIQDFISQISLEDIEKIRELKLAELILLGRFVILEKLGEDNYQYFISENFDSSKIGDLVKIYKNLLFIKQDILKRI